MEPKRQVDHKALEWRYRPVIRDRKVGDGFLFSLELDLRHVLSCFPCSLLVMLYVVNAELLSIGTSVLCPCWQVVSVELVSELRSRLCPRRRVVVCVHVAGAWC